MSEVIENSNGNSAIPWKIPLFIGNSLSLSKPRISSTLHEFIVFPKNIYHTFLLCPSYLISLLPRNDGPCHKLSDNWSITSLSSSLFIWPCEKACYLSKRGAWHHLTSFFILSTLLLTFFSSLKKHVLLIAPARTLGCEGSFSPSRCYEDRRTISNTFYSPIYPVDEWRKWGRAVDLVWCE